MAAFGGIVLQQEFDLLQTELEDYFGQQAEIRAGLRPEGAILTKPPELIRYEMVKETDLPVWAGGLMDQPHIWLGQYRIVDNTYKLFEALRVRNEKQSSQQASEERRE